MIIRAIKFLAITENGDFGFAFGFERNLTIIRASNSSGKSTLYNCLLYALGMEEIIGFKGEKALPYAVKEYFEYGGDRGASSAACLSSSDSSRNLPPSPLGAPRTFTLPKPCACSSGAAANRNNRDKAAKGLSGLTWVCMATSQIAAVEVEIIASAA